MRLPSHESQRDVFTAVGSLFLHAAIFAGVFLSARLAPESPHLTAVRFSGQTFEVDALGAPSDEEAEAPSAESATASPTEPPRALEEPPVNPTSSEPTPPEGAPPKATETRGDKQLPRPRADPTPTVPPPPQPLLVPPAPTTSAPAPPQDPFDLGLPGEESSGSSTPSSSSTRAYGEQGKAAGIVDLYPAFLKTLPLAAKTDPQWLSLPEGTKDYIDVKISIDDGGKLLPIVIVESVEHSPPEYLKRAVAMNRNFLLHGRFALSPNQPTGTQTLRLVATILKKDADPNTPTASGVRAFGLQGDPPSGVYFTYFSGHHVQIKMRRLD